MNESTKTPTPSEVSYLEDINKSRRIIDDLNLLPEGCKNEDRDDILDYHVRRIIFYLDLLNKHYQKKAKSHE